jgi:hypothetical protein
MLNTSAANGRTEIPEFIVRSCDCTLITGADGIAGNVPNIAGRRVNEVDDFLVSYILNL